MELVNFRTFAPVSLKQKIGYFLLNRKIKRQKRSKTASNLEVAHSIGIIFNATNQNSYEQANAFAQSIIQRNIQVLCMGFVDNKQQLSFFTDKKGVKFFSRKNLNWLGKPKNPSVDYFIDKPFDILIDLSLKDSFPIQYIVGLSKAKMKVGRFIEKNSYYDLMIDIRKEPKLESFIKQVGVYLSMFKVNIYVK